MGGLIPDDGDATLSQGVLVASSQSMLHLGDSTWTDYEVSFDLAPDSCDINSDRNDAIGVRAQDRDNMVLFVVTGCESEWQLVEGGIKTSVPNTKVRTGIGASFHVTVVVQGNKFSAYVQSNLLSTFINDSHPQGYVYVRLWPNSQWDDLRIRSLPY